jgi:thiaminase/transcriptional activator TenA
VRASDFSAELWQGSADIYQAIIEHPFVTGLTDGSLPAEAFTFYVLQDAHYLRGYARALAAVASRAPDTLQTAMFARHAANIVEVELGLHDSLMASLGIDPADLAATEEAPTTVGYVSYLLATISGGSYADGIAAVLPCYWIYWEVGKHLLAKGSPVPRYQHWIDTYSGDEFAAEVRDVIAVADAVGPGLSAAERDRAGRIFRTTSRYEWMFWDMGYHMRGWSV